MKLLQIAGLLVLGISASQAEASVSTSDMEKSYLKGKKQSLYGRSNLYSDLYCLYAHTIWANTILTYRKNLALAHGELGYGYIQLQYHHYALKAINQHMANPAYRTTMLPIIDGFEKRNFNKDKELKKFAEELGRCAVPHAKVKHSGTILVRAENFWNKLANQPYKQKYPKWVKDKQAWNSYASALMLGDFVKAANLADSLISNGDSSTLSDKEYLVAVDGALATGKTSQLTRTRLMRAAKLNPDKFARLVGMNPSDFKPKVEFVEASASSSLAGSMGAADNQARNQAEAAARRQCQNAGGKVLRVSSTPTGSYKATETSYRASATATAQCEFKPKI